MSMHDLQPYLYPLADPSGPTPAPYPSPLGYEPPCLEDLEAQYHRPSSPPLTLAQAVREALCSDSNSQTGSPPRVTPPFVASHPSSPSSSSSSSDSSSSDVLPRPASPQVSISASLLKKLLEAINRLDQRSREPCRCVSQALQTPASPTNVPEPSATAITSDVVIPLSPPMITSRSIVHRRRSSVEEIVDQVARDTSIRPRFRPTKNRPIQHRRHVTLTRAAGRPRRL